MRALQKWLGLDNSSINTIILTFTSPVDVIWNIRVNSQLVKEKEGKIDKQILQIWHTNRE